MQKPKTYFRSFSVSIATRKKKSVSPQVISNGTLNFVTNNFVIASQDFLKTLNIAQIHDVLTTCIKP